MLLTHLGARLGRRRSGTVHLFRLGQCGRGAAAAAALVSAVVPRALAGPLKESAETQRAAAIIKCARGFLRSSDHILSYLIVSSHI